jgi:secreted trypsin-like serine protease
MYTARLGRSAAAMVAAGAVALAALVPAPQATARERSYAASIVNGTVTSLSKWPYIVGIMKKSIADPYYAQFCGGSLVAPTIVLSAAHCTFDANNDPLAPAAVDVLVNADDLGDGNQVPFEGQRINVSSIIRHPAYNPNTIRNDFALFVLSAPAPATPVAIVPPPSDHRWAGGRPARVAGFGCQVYDAEPGDCTVYPTHLRETGLPMLSDRACENIGGVYALHFDRTNMVCAGSLGHVRQTRPGLQEGTAKSPCFGDSGGPLVVEGPSGADYQVGVVSWGPSACGVGPGVFSRIGTSSVRPWLRDNGVPVMRGAFTGGPALSIGGNFTPVAGDFDGNGRDDLLLYASGPGRDFLWRGNANNGFVNNANRVTIGGNLRPVAGDFNNDSRDDIFWLGPGDAEDILWQGTPTGFVRVAAPSVRRAAMPYAGDFNGDGYDDILFSGPGALSDLLLYGGAAGFTPDPSIDNDDPQAPVVGDFDGDGHDDVVWYGAGNRADALWRGSPTGLQGPGTATTVGGTFRPVAGDFDGDNRDDIMWFSPNGPDALRRGTSTGFQSAPEVVLDGTYVGVPGDYDGDAKTDIVWYGAGSSPDRHWRGTHR